MSESPKDIDWSLTTWEGTRRAQLRHALKLTLRERLEAAEGLADVARRFAELRTRRLLTSPAGEPVPSNEATTARESAPSGSFSTIFVEEDSNGCNNS